MEAEKCGELGAPVVAKQHTEKATSYFPLAEWPFTSPHADPISSKQIAVTHRISDELSVDHGKNRVTNAANVHDCAADANMSGSIGHLGA